MRAAVPAVAIVAVVGGVLLAVVAGVHSATLGYDYLAYDAAARRVLARLALYDTSFQGAGSFGLYYYPPPFILAVLPLAAALDSVAATWIWTAGLVAVTILAIALLPVRASVRWTILLLTGLSWPFVYSLKLGQVGPILLMLFVAAWRSMGRPAVMGVAMGLAVIVKLQPAVLFGWAVVHRRWTAVGIGLALIGLSSLVATVLVGAAAWSDFASLISRVSAPVTTPRNLTPGAVLYQSGFPKDAATAVQGLNLVAVALVTMFAWVRLSPVASYQVTVVASQLVSPILWEHYALLLLVPVAWLLERRAWWALSIPIALSIPMMGLVPALLYPLLFWFALLGCVADEVTGRSKFPLAGVAL